MSRPRARSRCTRRCGVRRALRVQHRRAGRLSAHRKGRVERQVSIVRDHVLAGRSIDSIAELDGAFEAWLPIRRAQVHRTHGQVISVRAEVDRAALLPLPEQPYLVTDKHLRRVAKDCLACSRPASTPSPPAASGPGSGSSCRSTEKLSPSVRSGPRGAAGSQLILVPGNAVRGWSTTRIGPVCVTDTLAPWSSNQPPDHFIHH